MPKKVELEVYTFKELMQRRSQRAIDKAREFLLDNENDFSYVLDMWKQALTQIGFNDPEIRFSGFSSQGDGASFTAIVDVEKLANFFADTIQPSDVISFDAEKREEDFRSWLVWKLNGKKETDPRYRRIIQMQNHVNHFEIVRSVHSHYVHENTCSVSAWLNASERHRLSYELFREFEESVEKLRHSLSCCIYGSLDDENDFYQSDEYAIEVSEANGWYFFDSGKFYGTVDEDRPVAETKTKRRVFRAKELKGVT